MIPDANVELLDTLDVTFVQGPPAERHRLHCASVRDDGRARPGCALPHIVPLQRGCWRRRGHGVQARGGAAIEIGQDGGGRQVALGDGNRGAF